MIQQEMTIEEILSLLEISKEDYQYIRRLSIYQYQLYQYQKTVTISFT